jgi:hypothetical protein
VAVRAVLFSGFAAGTFGLGLGWPRAEGSGRPLASAACGVEFGPPAGHLGGQRLDLALLLLNQFQQSLIARQRLRHPKYTTQSDGSGQGTR